MFTVGTGAAQTLSTSAGGLIAAFVSWRTVFPILGVLAGASTFALFWLRDRELRLPMVSNEPRPGYHEALRTPRMKALLALVALEGFLYMGSFSFLSGLLEQRFGLSALYIGLVMSASGLAQLVSARLLSRLLPRFGERSLMLAGGCSMASAYLLCAVANTARLVTLACALVGVGFTLCHTTLQTRATEAFPRGRATALSLFAFSLISSSALGTVCIGHAIEAVGYFYTYLVSGLALLVFTALVVGVLGQRSPWTAR
jgi:predicted MFS family arabinose efflux permease